MAKAPKRVHIEVANTFAGNQSWYYREIFTQGPYKLRVDIRVNAYDFQSHARVEVWNPTELKWNTVYAIPFARMDSTKRVSYTERNVSVSPFWNDRQELVENAEKILF